MKIEKHLFIESPESIAQFPVNCIWIPFKKGEKIKEIKAVPLQWIDWKMRNTLSRHLLDLTSKKKGPHFYPTQGRLGCDYIAIEEIDNWEDAKFLESSCDMNWDSILIYPLSQKLLEQKFTLKNNQKDSFKKIYIGSDK